MSALTITDPVLHAFAEEVGTEGPVAVEGGRTRWDLGGPPAGDAACSGPRRASSPTRPRR